MHFDEISNHDFEMKYVNTVVGYRPIDSGTPFQSYWVKSSHSVKQLAGYVIESLAWDATLLTFKDYEWNIDVPALGNVSVNKMNLFLGFKLMKQWKRSYSNSFVGLQVTTTLPHLFKPDVMSASVAKAVWNREFFTPNKLVQELKAGK